MYNYPTEIDKVYKEVGFVVPNYNYIPKSKEELIACLKSKVWRLNNLYKIVDRQGNLVKFKMNLAQHIVYALYCKHDRLIILKSRQLGISTLFLVMFFDDIVFNKYMTVGLMAQDSIASENLLNRAKILWEHFPKQLKDMLDLSEDKNNKSNLKLSNGSTMLIGTSFRSGTLQRLHVSEMGKIANQFPKKAKEVKTGSFQTIHKGGKIIVESTAEGENMFKDDWYKAKANLKRDKMHEKDFYPIFLNWLYDPTFVSDIDEVESPEMKAYFDMCEKDTGLTIPKQYRNAYIARERELHEYMKQEYPFTDDEAFLYRQGGNFYAKLLNIHTYRKPDRIVPNLYDDKLPLFAAMDLGSGKDYNFIVFFQWYSNFRFIGEYFNAGEPIQHYSDFMRNYEENIGTKITDLILPHDARVREMTSGVTRAERYVELGWPVRVLSKPNDIMDGIDAVRQAIINGAQFDSNNCTKLLESLLKYTKIWDDKKETWRKGGWDNEFAHGADAARYAVDGCLTGSSQLISIPRGGMV